VHFGPKSLAECSAKESAGKKGRRLNQRTTVTESGKERRGHEVLKKRVRMKRKRRGYICGANVEREPGSESFLLHPYQNE